MSKSGHIHSAFIVLVIPTAPLNLRLDPRRVPAVAQVVRDLHAEPGGRVDLRLDAQQLEV